MPHGYWHLHTLVLCALQIARLLLELNNILSPSPQILSFGAGFDSLYFRLKAVGLLSCTVVYEVDFPSVASRKAALIKGTENLAMVVGGVGGRESGMTFLAAAG